MSAPGFTLFDTPLGRLGVAWSERGLVAVQLPEARASETRARLLRRAPEAREAAPPLVVQGALDGISALLRGERRDLSGVPLDVSRVPPFHQRVYDAARGIPAGATLTYGEVATKIGAPGEARAVGQALARNPFAIVVPCHRVLAAGGRLGGFSANGGVATKLRLLTLEGALPAGPPGLFDAEPALGFDAEAAVAALREADAALARVIDRVGPFRLELKRTPSTFAALSEAIVHQQLSGRAAATIFARVCALFPRGAPAAEAILRMPDAKLRGAGLSAAKLLALRDLAGRERAGEVPSLRELRALDDETIVARLAAVRGIGRWTAQMLLIFRLGRPDVLPCEDFGIRKGLALALRKRAFPAPAEVAERGERWRPWRTVASWYLWQATGFGKP